MPYRTKAALLVAAAALWLAGCGEAQEFLATEVAEQEAAEIAAFLADARPGQDFDSLQQGIRLMRYPSNSGLKPLSGDLLVTNFSGFTLDELVDAHAEGRAPRPFDTSFDDEDRDFAFNLNQQGQFGGFVTVTGFMVAANTMELGDSVEVYMHSAEGFGRNDEFALAVQRDPDGDTLFISNDNGDLVPQFYDSLVVPANSPIMFLIRLDEYRRR